MATHDDAKKSNGFHVFSAIFWISVPILSYLYPRLDGRGHIYAWECFSFLNAGIGSWVVRFIWYSGVVPLEVISVLGIAFLPVLIFLCVRGVGIKGWGFLTAWYAAGVFLFWILGSL
jgi:hypothetical protein